MSILIKGMEMPTCCCWCPFCRKTYTECGSIYSADCIIKKMPIKFSELDLRDGLCPLIEVPPHGDLIDKDETMNEILEERGEDNACWFAGIVNDMPAIIHADKDGET